MTIINPEDESPVIPGYSAIVATAADEAIAQLTIAEKILNAIAEEHRPVEAWVRQGMDTAVQYRMTCCVVCRDAAGRPVSAPCRTMSILDSYGGE